MFNVFNQVDLPKQSDYPYPWGMTPKNIVERELNGGDAQKDWATALVKRRKIDLGNPSQERIAAAAGDLLTQTDVSRLERGLSHPIDDLSVSQLNAYLAALKWTVEEFIKETGLSVPWYGKSSSAALIDAPEEAMREIPLFDGIGAGPGFEDANQVGIVMIPARWDGPHAAYIVRGNSMAPEIPDGAQVTVKLTEAVELGDLVAAYHPDHGTIVKRLLIANEKQRQAVFASRNPDYAKILFCDGCRIIGKVRKVETFIDVD